MNIKNIKNFFSKIKKDRLTFIVIPHSNATPKNLSIPTSVVYSFFLFVFIIIMASFFIVTKHINYLNTLTHNIILENKLEYFSKELIKNRNFLSKLKNIDSELRVLLNMKEKKAIIDANAIGGPKVIDEIIATKINNSKIIFSPKEFTVSLRIMRQEILTQLESAKEINSYIKKQKNIEKSKPSIWPTSGGYISSVFGYRVHPVSGRTELHKGIDIANRRGTPIIATADGVVKYANWLGGYGKLILIKHGYGYSTLYGHLSKILVKHGQKVKKGDRIGLMGNTGISTGSHLHYEIRYYNKSKNPLNFVDKNN
ncbi:MAG: peptidoglycan DD-metalloendopeptidase family protein [Bacteroidetes bacterium]|nr:peptidoglycan DD-metalloendopeptidase family protein [Bacteroidota bacterium]